jgi:hypothetical protein
VYISTFLHRNLQVQHSKNLKYTLCEFVLRTREVVLLFRIFQRNAFMFSSILSFHSFGSLFSTPAEHKFHHAFPFVRHSVFFLPQLLKCPSGTYFRPLKCNKHRKYEMNTQQIIDGTKFYCDSLQDSRPPTASATRENPFSGCAASEERGHRITLPALTSLSRNVEKLPSAFWTPPETRTATSLS